MENPTIVSASLSDKELQDSIDKMVANFDRGLQTMLEHSNEYVGKIQESLQEIGNTKFGAKGSNDGGVAKQTKQHKDLTEAVTKETQKLQDLQQSLSGASDREQNFISQKERAANTIAQENELLSKQRSELAALKAQQQQLSDAAQKSAQSAQQQEASINRLRERLADLKLETRNAKASLDLLKLGKNEQLSPIAYNKNKAYDELAVANKLWDIMKRLKMDMNNGSLMTGNATEPIQKLAEYFKISREEAEKMIRALRESSVVMGKYRMSFDTRFGLYDLSMEKRSMLDKDSPFYSAKSDWEIRQESASKSYELALRREESAERDLTQATQQSNTIRQESLNLDVKIQEKLKDISETRGRIAAATKEQSEADKNASQAAKEKANIQSQVANQEKQVAEAKKQLTTATQQHTDAETKSSRATKEKTLTLDQGQAAINTAIQSEKKYTDEIRNQAAAIRATKEWQEKGRYWLDGTQLIDPSVYKGTRAERQAQGTLEEQLLRIQQKRTEESVRQAQSSRQYAENIRQAAQELRGLMTGKHGVDSIDVGGRAIYRDTADVTIEQQLTSLVSERGREFNLQRAVTEAIADNEKRISEELQKEVENERKINSERQNRINTKSADFWSNAERENIVSILAQRNQIDRSRVKNWDEETSSIQTLSSALKQYQTAYQRLTAEQRSSTVGKQLIADMQVIERSIQKARAELSRPIDLESVMRLPQKSLDDIAYKMRQLASYRSGLNVETQTKEIDQVNRKYAELQKKMNEVMAKNSQMTSSNNILANSWRYMRNRLAFYLTVSTGMTLIRDLARVRSEYEMDEKALGTLLNSAERGTRIFNELSNMALVSPYTLIELSAAAKQLTAYDVAAKDVVDTTRRLADISAAVGIPVERLTYALGQVKAYGHLTSQDARQFLNAGVPLVKELANRYSELEGRLVSTADVYDRMKKHAISYNDVLSVLTSMTDEGGRFFDYQAKMAETLKVRLANLSLAYNNMLNDMGKANGGAFTTGIKGLTQLLKHWREIERVLGTVVVGIGAYRTATILAGLTTTTAVGKNAFGAWINLARGIKSAKDATALFSLTIKSIPFVGWVTAIASIVSYFVLFNNSSDETKQKLQDIATAFEGIRKEVTDLFADAISTDSLGTQLTKLKDMLELAETELGITIPINLEDVNESNVKQKLRETKNTIDNYINFSQTFSEAAVDTRFNESMTDFGTTARSTYTSVTESINTVKVALQELVDAGKASKRDIEILKELDNKPKDGESRIEFFQRLVKLYEELGLIGKKETVIPVGGTMPIDNMIVLQQKQEASLDRLEIKNKTVFETMLNDVQGYYSKSSIAAYQFEQQIERVAKSINLENIPVSERTAKLEVAINQEAAKNNWNEFAIQYAKWVANQKFGLNITISEESKKDSEIELSDWQKRMQAWADKNGITFSLNFIEKEDEKAYADRMLQSAKDAQGKLDVLRRKLSVGTGSKEEVETAKKDYENARLLALKAGADLSSLDKKRKSSGSKKDPLLDALKQEISLVEKLQGDYDKLTKGSASQAEALETIRGAYGKTIRLLNAQLGKYGLPQLDISQLITGKDPHKALEHFKQTLDTLVSKGLLTLERSKEIEAVIDKFTLSAKTYDLDMITKGLNNELGKLKDEYELAVELDANPEMGNLFADWMGIDMSTLPHTAEEYAKRMTKALNKYLTDEKSGIEIGSLLALTDDDLRMFQQRVDNKELNQVWVDKIVKNTKEARNALKKENSDIAKEWDGLVQKYAEYEYKIAQVQRNANKERKAFALKYGSNAQKERALVLTTEIDAEKDQAKKQELINQLKQLLAEIAGDDDSKLKIKVAIDKKELEEGARIAFEEFQKSPEWIVATGDLAGMTDKAIGGLISRIEEYKKKAKYLDPKQIKQLNKALISLYKKQREGNPFKALSTAMMEAKERVSVYEDELKDTQNELDELSKKQSESFSEDRAKKIDKLIERIKDLKQKIKDGLKLDPKDIVEGIGAMIAVAKQASDIFTEMFDSLGVSKDITQQIEGMFTVLDKGMQGALIGASFGGFGAIIGGVIGAFTGLLSVFGGGKDDITLAIEKSERSVKQLEIAYKRLEVAIEEAYGAAKWGAEQAAIANKKLQLAELKRQLALERSRDSKDRDEGKINDLMGQIEDLKIEIEKSIKDITNDLLGISSVGNAAEELVSSMIDAFRKGEDYMLHYDQTFEEMINNMVMKSIVGRVIGDRLQSLWDRIDAVAKEKGEPYQKQIEELMAAKKANEDSLEFLENSGLGAAVTKWYSDSYSGITLTDKLKEDNKKIEEELKRVQRQYSDAIAPTPEDVQSIRDDAANWRDSVKSEFEAYMELFGIKFGDSADGKQLSSLQQGISQITEVTAQSLEAYANSISQQAYLRNDLLTQIRDAIIGMDMDVQVATQAQMLLQLQQSYQVQMSIESILQGVLVPSGRAFAVELLS